MKGVQAPVEPPLSGHFTLFSFKILDSLSCWLKRRKKRQKYIQVKIFLRTWRKTKQNSPTAEVQPGTKSPPQVTQINLNGGREEAAVMCLIQRKKTNPLVTQVLQLLNISFKLRDWLTFGVLGYVHPNSHSLYI